MVFSRGVELIARFSPYLSVLFNRQGWQGFSNSFRIIFLPPSHFSSPTIRSEDLPASPTGSAGIPHFLNVRDFNSSRRRFRWTIFRERTDISAYLPKIPDRRATHLLTIFTKILPVSRALETWTKIPSTFNYRNVQPSLQHGSFGSMNKCTSLTKTLNNLGRL